MIKNTHKMPEKSCFYWDILKIKRFKIASPPIYDNLETKFRFYGGKPPLLLRSMRIDFNKFRKGDFKLWGYLMKKQLQELKQEFLNFSTSQNEYVVNDKKYIVVSHFVGNKNINEILIKLAQKQAYSEMF